ncbi:MAG TPA: hypothetical protein VNS09_08125 [Solirubrobacter sp.]|nr:hypothetical protein [Solirubrobacter sp.]
MRALAVLIGAVAALAGSYGAFTLMQKVGPQDRTNEYGYGAAGGDLLSSAGFGLVVDALRRELGPEGELDSIAVERERASAVGRVAGRRRIVEVDGAGRSKANDGDPVKDGVFLSLAKLDASVVDALLADARSQGGGTVESLRLLGLTREWTVSLDGGEPDRFVANLDGGGLRLPGEPNPAPIGASADSLLREKNLTRALDAARAAAPDGARVLGWDVRPERVSFQLAVGGRELRLDYGYDAQLISRELRAASGAPRAEAVRFEALDPGAVERMASGARRAARGAGLAGVQYVLLNLSPGSDPTLAMYLPQGTDPPYVVADLRGRHLTWPGRS